jgi:DNA-binding transcriptional regulator YiaG
MKKGKNSNPSYASVGGRVPNELRRLFKAKLALDDLHVNVALERLLQGYVDGHFVITEDASDVTTFADSHKPTDKQPANSTELQSSRPSPAAGGDTSATEFEAIRLELDLSQRAYADALGIHHSSVGKYRKQGCPEDVLTKARALLADDSDND